ncbi:J domain-containing protein [Novosphingobium sp. PP1Y]|uniref:J domain-containing protein n=1 Tax=Novosphingobium sp. PP1Y TaxID=702113 RepID=UPI00020EE9EB|nr:DnaJ domain-containing protein [Novosphingobium sp. PP1Y]CCA91740.1 heat shock protein DnaJ domain-containing protein [Novosphingobium sp. PP1Y]
MQDDDFVDYYQLLQVNAFCDVEVISLSYRHLAKKYHPDHPKTANAALFKQIVEAYNVLKRPDKRAEYDLVYHARVNTGTSAAHPRLDIGIDEKVALSDAEMQRNILLLLYKRRRNSATDCGVYGFHVQTSFELSDDLLDFHVWYLKSKGFINMNEQGMLVITVEGIDHVISLHQPRPSEKYLMAPTSSRDG